MQVAVTFRHMDSTDALKDYANEKVSKVSKYLSRATNAHVILCVEKLQHKAEVLIDAGGIHCRGEAHSENMYKSIDEATDKIVRQVKRYQEKIHSHKGKHLGTMAVTHQIVELPEEATQRPHIAQIVESKQIEAKPMSVDEAVMQMDLIHNDFFIFQNVDSKQLNVIYRREGGRYGLIAAATS
ncbi:MAG: ribosome-associated translation inhibitor RaiA [Deltaproteobacteria bacterium]|nr:ribosome-associated translation inhibitor RaiA [Deltaproteobacteria bacterium]